MADVILLHDTFAPESGSLHLHAPDVRPGAEVWDALGNRWLFGGGFVYANPGFNFAGGEIDTVAPIDGSGIFFLEVTVRINDPKPWSFGMGWAQRDVFSGSGLGIGINVPAAGSWELRWFVGFSAYYPITSDDIVLRVVWNSNTGQEHAFVNGVPVNGGAAYEPGTAPPTPGSTIMRSALNGTGFPEGGTPALQVSDFKFGYVTDTPGPVDPGEFWTGFVNTREVV